MKTLEDFAGDPMEDKPPYPYEGPEALRQTILDALMKVVDPEVAMSIVDVGLVYGVTVDAQKVHVLITARGGSAGGRGALVSLGRLRHPRQPCRGSLTRAARAAVRIVRGPPARPR